MSCDAVKNYIRSSALQCESEMDVFHAVVRWLKHDELRKNKAITLMRHVRFGLMTTSHLLGDVWKEPIMISNEACQEMLRKAIEYCSKPNEQPFVKEEWCTPRFVSVLFLARLEIHFVFCTFCSKKRALLLCETKFVGCADRPRG